MSQSKLWGGVFSKSPDELAWKFGQSLVSDSVLIDEELAVSIAHAKMLAHCGIVDEDDGVELVEGLEFVGNDLQDGLSTIPVDSEDIHSAVESLLEAKVGDVAKRLHAGRSRNDQIATVTRLWLKKKCAEVEEALTVFQKSIVALAEGHLNDPMPGYTHQQPAQPVTIGFWLMAHFWMLERDKARFAAVGKMSDQCPLGSAALSGTSLPVDRQFTSSALGFSAPVPNALDAVSDRDFVGDALHACATLMQHLSRMSQEIVLFSTAEFGYVQLDESFSTGSSIMPQKRNPDLAELIRGRTGRTIGNWTSFMSMMKGLPLGYNRDQQEDKPPLFDSLSLCLDSIALSEAMLVTASFDTAKLEEAAGAGFSTATGVAEALVAGGVPFRTAHETVGKAVKACLNKGIGLADLQEADFPAGAPAGLKEALANSTVRASVASRKSEGGPAPSAMVIQLEKAKTLVFNTPMNNLFDQIDNMSDAETIALTNKYCSHNYHPLPVNIVKAKGAKVWDGSGKEYFDCIGSYSAVANGHLSKPIIDALKTQLDKVTLTSRAVYSSELALFLKTVCEFTGMDVACPMNTGAEAVETAIKLARKWAYTVKGVPIDKAEIITAQDNFHGRTTTIVSFSTDSQYKDLFGPHTPGFLTVPFGDIEAIKAAITPNTAAVLMEPILAEGGILYPPKGFMAELRKVCSENNVLLIWDEIQTGFCRTGKKFAWEHEDAKPDLMCLGKALGGGVMPVSAVVGSKGVMGVFEPGDHGSTFGGNPLACVVAIAAMQEMEALNLAENADSLGQLFIGSLKALHAECVEDIRGSGLLIGLEVKEGTDTKALSQAFLENGMLTKETRSRTFRFAPPLTATEDEVIQMVEKIGAALGKVAAQKPEAVVA